MLRSTYLLAGLCVVGIALGLLGCGGNFGGETDRAAIGAAFQAVGAIGTDEAGALRQPVEDGTDQEIAASETPLDPLQAEWEEVLGTV